jgi:DNA sulfur modification protein DndB
MAFLKQSQIDELRSYLVTDLSTLGKINKAKKGKYIIKNVDRSLVEEMLADGWEEFGGSLKKKIRLRKSKESSIQFIDDLWCQFYELGYRCLNSENKIKLPYGKEQGEESIIDVIAANDESVIIVQCKSSEKPKNYPSLKTEFDSLEKRLIGFRKAIDQIFEKGLKVKYIFATRRLRIDVESAEIQKLKSLNSFYYNDNTYEYINSLIKSYRGAAFYQFLGILYKDQLISSERIEVPAIEGEMGGKKYYMFSIEPDLLLKIGFILHRTKANESEMPTYQRLLVPNRLQSITKFINQGGYFPNSIILNFTQRKHKIQFEHSSRGKDTQSRYGILKIPNAYSTAYIIDGQHRIYGYANSDFKESNTIPVVAFTNLDSTEQLQIFMDINQNQKAVSPSLRLTLEEDLYWDSDRADSRIKALRSSIIKELSNSINGPLYNKISIGEDTSLLAFKPFADALIKSMLLPTARGNGYDRESIISTLYNINNQNHKNEMERAKKNIVQFINLCYGHVEEKYPEIFEREQYFILSNRGTYAFINLIGSLNRFETTTGILTLKSTPLQRFDSIVKYLNSLLDQIKSISSKEEETMLTSYGTGADTKWLRFFQSLVNKRHRNFEPPELIDWKERQDDDLQEEGRKYAEKIERYMKTKVIEKLKLLFGDDWDIEIGKIQRECEARAKQEIERQYKEGLGRKDIPWTDMFFITDYKEIIQKYWASTPDPKPPRFRTFQEDFSIDVGLGGFRSKEERTKWISFFNSYRNLLAHRGTKEKGLNKEEVTFLKSVYLHLYPTK